MCWRNADVKSDASNTAYTLPASVEAVNWRFARLTSADCSAPVVARSAGPPDQIVDNRGPPKWQRYRRHKECDFVSKNGGFPQPKRDRRQVGLIVSDVDDVR